MTVLRSLMRDWPVDPVERRRAWAGAFAPFLDMATTEFAPAPGTLALTRRQFGVLTLVGMEAPPQTLRRTPEMVAGQGLDDLLFLFWLEGEGRVTTSDGARAFGRLQGVVLDLAQPATLAAGLARATGLVLPRALVAEAATPLAALHGAVLDPASDPVSRLFLTGVQDLAEDAAAVRADQIPQVVQTVALLATAALRRLAQCRTLAGRAATDPTPTRRLEEAAA